MATINPLIPFNMIIDTDVGLIKMIDKKYHDKEAFYTAMLSAPVKPLIYHLLNRENINPLSIVLQDTEMMDVLYDQFMEEEYQSIIANSVTTDLFNAVKLFLKSGTVVPTILCENQLEVDMINKLNIDGKTLQTSLGTLRKQNFDLYDAIYVKNIKDILKVVDKLNGKTVYVANYKFNMEKEPSKDGAPVLLKDVCLLCMDTNIGKIVDIYHIDDSFIAKG